MPRQESIHRLLHDRSILLAALEECKHRVPGHLAKDERARLIKDLEMRIAEFNSLIEARETDL